MADPSLRTRLRTIQLRSRRPRHKPPWLACLASSPASIATTTN